MEERERISKAHSKVEKRELMNSLEKILKSNFRMNYGQPKFTTIQSLKGLESNIIVTKKHSKATESIYNKLLYTAITRAKKILYIIDLSDSKFSEFCKNHELVENLD